MKKKEYLISNEEKICILISLIYLISILWINFNGKVFYNFDMYSDAYVAKLMSESKTLFPQNWVFGNQCYVTATPVLAALIYNFIHNSIISMALASSIMTGIIIVSFVWCCRPFCRLRNIIFGVFCLSGAVILGGSASSYVNGFQILYTMASYYACYVIGILICLGVYLRIKYKKSISKIMILLAVLMDFSLGIQSLRQMLVMNIPFILIEGFEIIRNEKNRQKWENKQMLFVGILFSVNAFGIITSKMIHINQKTIIDHPALNIVPNQLLANFISSTKELLVINGLRFCMNGIKWIPLFCIALFINFIVYKSIYLVIRKKERTPISDIIIFLTMSLMCVYLVGIFIFRVRAIYYFVWYLLVVFCFMYYIDDSRKEKVVWWMIIFSIVNYMCNFTPDYITYCKTNKIYKTINQDLEKQNIKRLYFDWNTAPIIAAYSNDRICAGSIKFDLEYKSKSYLYPVQYLKPKDIFNDSSKKNSYIVFSNWTMDYLGANATEEYRKKLFNKLKCVDTKTAGSMKYYFYEYDNNVIDMTYE